MDRLIQIVTGGQLQNLNDLINWGGYFVLMAIVFAETGLLVGFFLPGDSLLVTTGVLINAGLINPFGLSPVANLALMNAALILMAIIGDAVGFWIGHRAGPALYGRKQSFFFRRDHLLATQRYYEAHGGKTIVIARFMPFARTFAPVVAGIGGMPYPRFAMFNVVGGVAWVVSMTVLGFILGKTVEAKSIEKIVYLIIVISVMPVVIGALRARRSAKQVEDTTAKLEAAAGGSADEPKGP